MSESDDLSTPANLPADSEIEQCLRRVVRDAVKKEEQITINLARSRAEKELGLDAGFFKDNDVWKKKSKDVINQAVDDPESPAEPKTKPTAKAGTKRKSDETQPGRKRVKKSPVVNSEDREESEGVAAVQSEQLEADSDHEKGKAQPKSEEESALSEPPEDESEPAELKQNGKLPEDDDSELSSVIDDPPPKKSRQKKKSSSPSAAKSKPAKPSKSSKADKPSKSSTKEKENATSLSPDEEEIKRLQSWLLKCGIRKLWYRELAPYSTSKEKIQHLKKMLEDVGMTPRYSVEKARQIKEARELRAELEAAREFNEQWGHGSDDEDGEKKDGGGKDPDGGEVVQRRLKPKGLVDFGDSGEDSD